MNKQPLCIFGEVLFDHFPDGKSVLGGAPFNVAWHLQAFSQSPRFISRVGNDADGEIVRKAMCDWGMDTASLQTDPTRPTGQVSVSFNDGEPEYAIVEHCAYDSITAEEFTHISDQTNTSPTTNKCGLLYHGSLALREHHSREALQQLKANTPATVFMDVNLRSPWWKKAQVLEWVDQADWIKLNTDELALLSDDNASDDPARSFMEKHQIKGLILTHGSKGAEIICDTGENYQVQPSKTIKVVDTVGAGDAFTSIIILGLANNWSLETTLQRAQSFASEIVGNRGATVSDRSFYEGFSAQWSL